MAKKMTQRFTATLALNPEKAGAWIAEVSISNLYAGVPNVRLGSGAGEEVVVLANRSAWKNASAAKRWIKEQVQSMTPRKSVKMVAGESLDAKGKPTSFTGVLEYKVDYVEPAGGTF